MQEMMNTKLAQTSANMEIGKNILFTPTVLHQSITNTITMAEHDTTNGRHEKRNMDYHSTTNNATTKGKNRSIMKGGGGDMDIGINSLIVTTTLLTMTTKPMLILAIHTTIHGCIVSKTTTNCIGSGTLERKMGEERTTTTT